MTFRKTLITLSIILLLISSCKKDEIEVPKPLPDSRYPTTYLQLTNSELVELNAAFAGVNSHDSLYLNDFGFVEGKIFLKESDTINADLVVEQTEALISNYKDFMGIPHNQEISVSNDLTAIDYMISPIGTTDVYTYFELVIPDFIGLREFYAEIFEYEYDPEPFSHYFYILQNNLSSAKLTSTRLNLYFHESDNSMEVFGHWYPDAFIPTSQIYSQDEALDIASNVYSEEVSKKLWQGNDDSFEVNVEKVLVPLKSDNKIELHECWKFDAVSWNTFSIYNVNVDTQTGDVVSHWISYVEY